MKSNERHNNHNPIHENSGKMATSNKYYIHENQQTLSSNQFTKIKKKMFKSTIFALFSWFFLRGLALGCEVRWFYIVFICFPTQQILVNRKHPNISQY